MASLAQHVILAVEQLHRTASGAPDDAALARAVVRLSDLYTSDRQALTREQADDTHLAAKCGYFLASDAPKVVLALDEAAARSRAFARLAHLDRVRVLDLGAGVGATSCGFLAWLAAARARRASSTPARVSFHAIEFGAPATRAYECSVRTAAHAAGVEVDVHVEARDFRSDPVASLAQSCDVVLCQTALNELLIEDRSDPQHSPSTREMVARWSRAAPLLIIEPALRSTTRALMALRDALVSRSPHVESPAHVVAPCLHQQACPMRAKLDDWCHEARRIDPTPRVAAIDRIVGRRDGRALFAYLATAPGPAPSIAGTASPPISINTIRIVTDTLGSRGKTERVVCRADGELRLMRLLDRESRPGNALFVEAERGLAATVNPMPPNDRIGPEVAVDPLPALGDDFVHANSAWKPD